MYALFVNQLSRLVRKQYVVTYAANGSVSVAITLMI